jgi:hypothetical protein
MSKADRNPSAFEAMKAMERQIQRCDDAGLFDGMKAFAKAWREKSEQADKLPSPVDDLPPPRKISRPAPKPPKWTVKGLKPIERAKLMLADRKLFPNGHIKLSIKAVHRTMINACNEHGIKPWSEDTTGRAKSA